MPELNGQSTQSGVPGVKGENTGGGDGVFGTGRRGVVGESETFQGVLGKSRDNAGVVGESQKFHAVFAISHSSNNGGVIGINDAGGFGVIGRGRVGVTGESETFQGVLGTSQDNAGVVGESAKFHAVFGISHDANNAGVFGTNDKGGFGVIGVSEQGIGISGRGGTLAGSFEGNVEVTGDLSVQGHSIIQLLKRIEELEKRLERQQPRVDDLVGRLITVTGGGQGILRVTGSGFSPNFGVTIRVVTRFRFIGDFPITTNGQGEFDGQIKLDASSEPIFIAGRDNRRDDFDLTGLLWSNTVRIPEVF